MSSHTRLPPRSYREVYAQRTFPSGPPVSDRPTYDAHVLAYRFHMQAAEMRLRWRAWFAAQHTER
jgi:hypothetical protein